MVQKLFRMIVSASVALAVPAAFLVASPLASAQSIAGNNAACVSITAPLTVLPGQVFPATITMKSTGMTMWVQSKHLLRSHQTFWGVFAVPLSTNMVRPTQSHSFTVKVRAPAAPGMYPFQWQMWLQPNMYFGSVCAKTIMVVPSPKADVSLTKTVSTPLVAKGSEVTYTLTVRNGGPVAAQNVIVDDVIPFGLSLISVMPTSCTLQGNHIRCPIAMLQTGETKTITLQFSTAPATCDASIVNTATVTSTTLDLNQLNNTASASLRVTCAPPSAENELTVVVKSMASTNTAVKNQKNITLLAFEANATNEDILLTSLTFDAAQGSLLNGQNYILWVDTDNNGAVDTIMESGVSAVSSKVTFGALVGGGYVVPSTQTVRFEIHTDVASSLFSNTLELKFATAAPTYIASERLSDGSSLNGIKTDGSCSTTCETTVSTTSSTLWSFRDQGDLLITKSTTPIRSRQLLGGALSEEILRLTLRAETEDIDVTRLVFTADGSEAGAFASNIDRLDLYKVGDTTPFASATVSGCGGASVPANSMCANMLSAQLIVTKGTNLGILARARVKADTDGGVSGTHVKLKLDSVAGAQARGFVSSNNLAANDGDAVAEGELFIGTSSPAASQTILGNDNVVVMSKVTAIINANPNANGTSIPTGLSQIGMFRFTAAPNTNSQNGLRSEE